LGSSALLLFFLDPIFNFLHVGYEDLVGDGKQYFFVANFFSITSYLFILFSFLFEKDLSNKAFRENEILISFLNKANEKITNQNSEIKIEVRRADDQAGSVVTSKYTHRKAKRKAPGNSIRFEI